MAAFGIAASAFGVVSLALELLEVAKSAHRSVKLMQNVLSNTSELQIGLSTIESLLTEISTLCADARSDCGISMCLEQSRSRLQVLYAIIEDIRATKSTHREKIKKALRVISYDEKISDASRLLKETTDCLTLGLLVLQIQETRQQSIDLSTINETTSWIAAQQTRDVDSLRTSNDVKGLMQDLSLRLASLETSINQSSSNDTSISSWTLVQTDGRLTELHPTDETKPTVPATSKNGKSTPRRAQKFTKEAQNQIATARDLLGYHNQSTFLNTSEVYSITHRDLNLLLGTLSIIYMRKKHRMTSREKNKEKNSDSILSWEAKIRFSPSWYSDTSLWARIWTNAIGGCTLQQSLAVVHTVPSSDEIWSHIRYMDVVSIRKKFMDKKYSVNTVDEYGRSLLGLACRNGQSESVRFLLDAGAAIQGVDDSGRNALLYGFDIGGGLLGAEYWTIYNILVERCQMDPSEPDRNGRNFWHLFCESVSLEKEFSWKSISPHFRHILNEVDERSRTSIFILSSNPKGDIDLFRWHLNNKANISIPQTDGLTCLHAVIASLQPRRESPYMSLEDLTGYSFLGSRDLYNEKDREYQRKRIELLICHGANVFAVSDNYGTPTDMARLTGNLPLWLDALRSSGYDPKRVLAADKKISRHRHFLSALQNARNQQRQKKVRWQSLQDILAVLDDFEENNKQPPSERIIPEWEYLPTSPLAIYTKPHQEMFLHLKEVVENAISENDYVEGQGWSLFVNEDISGGKYQVGFLDQRTRLCLVHPSYQEEYENFDRHLDTLAKIASGDSTIRADTIDWETYRRHVNIIKAAAVLAWNSKSQFVPLRNESMYASENADSMTEMPGSWPAEEYD